MEITEVRIKLMEEPGERLKAFCSITFDNCFVVRDLKIIEGQTGPFVAMPSRKLTAHCSQCGMKNHLRAQYCNQCGSRQSQDRMPMDADGRAKLYADIAHPINSACREMIQDVVVREFEDEVERAKQPDYVSRYDDFDMDYGDFRRSAPAAPPADHREARGAETRVDQAHQRRAAHANNHLRPAALDGTRNHAAAPAPAQGPAPRRDHRGFDGFGAGIFPEK
ncbi:MAG TPA: SpoVG family protein [Lacipirellulaceae bacterium]|nr:SpoVG family protein [Lacipirellulaceae bacterium]